MALVAAFLALAAGGGGCGGGGSQQGKAPDPGATNKDEFESERAALKRKLQQLRARSRLQARDPGPYRGVDLGAIGSGLPAEVGVTVGSPQSGIGGGGGLSSGPAWSTIKLPIALRVLSDAGGPDQLTEEQLSLIERALTASDNEAAAELFAGLSSDHGGPVGASRAVTEVLRWGGDTQTEVSTQGRDGFSPYGQTQWSLQEQARFMAALAGGCIGSEDSRDYLLETMGRVTSDAWGLGSAGVPARWKSGWGPDPAGRYLLRQMGVIEVQGQPVVVTLAVAPDDGSFESGQAIASQLAQRLVGLVARNPPADLRC